MKQQIQLLGMFNVESEGTTSALVKNARGGALLTYLIVTQQPQSREVVADLLWENSTTKKSLKNLRTLLPLMKRTVPGLEVTRQTVAYQSGPEDSIDWVTLNEGLTANDLTRPEGPARLNAALNLYQGQLMGTFYLTGATRFNEWLTVERENLRQQVLVAYHRLCAAYAEQKAWVKGVAAAQQWLEIDELDEEALRQLMQFLAASGQVAVALKQYEHSRQRLWQEMALDPEPTTVELAHKLEQLKDKFGEGLSWAGAWTK